MDPMGMDQKPDTQSMVHFPIWGWQFAIIVCPIIDRVLYPGKAGLHNWVVVSKVFVWWLKSCTSGGKGSWNPFIYKVFIHSKVVVWDFFLPSTESTVWIENQTLKVWYIYLYIRVIFLLVNKCRGNYSSPMDPSWVFKKFNVLKDCPLSAT